MYRFRKIDNLLGQYQELDNQEIYFSDIESLNDPMEGFREFFWDGDEIVWKNLFKHYLLCLEVICGLAYLSDEELFSPGDIPIFLDEKKLPTEQYKQIYQEVCDRFFASEGVREYINFLAASPYKIGRDELYAHLKSIHLLAFYTITEVHVKHKLRPKLQAPYPDYSSSLKQIIDAWQRINNEEDGQEKIKILFKIQKEVMMEADLALAYKLKDTPASQRGWFIFSEFPNAYLNEIIRLTYPEGYVACFMDDCTNPVVWGHYADGHKGACLKFRTKEIDGSPSIDLRCIVGWGSSGAMYGYRTFSFRKINYSNQFPAIDFFRSIGRLPVGQLMEQWYTNQAGNDSQCAIHFKNKDTKEDWRKNYWNNYDSSFFIKLKDWEYEQEQRLFLSSGLDTYSDPKTRKLKYRFEDLEAIIFGVRTPVEDKVKIIKIIEEKCKENNRNDFDFYQVVYSSLPGKMEVKKLDLFSREVLG